MKNVLAVLTCLVGLTTAGLAIIALYDPEGADKTLAFIFGTLAVANFLGSWFVWKPSRQN